MSESSTWADPAKNRLYITFHGYMTLEDAEKLKEDYARALALCRPGFTILTDAQGYRPGTEDVQEVIASMVKMDAAAGVSRIARVTGTKPLGSMQIGRLAKEAATEEYTARHFETIEEAEAYLDSDLDA